MKILVEAIYKLDQEPKAFHKIKNVTERKVYTWQDRRTQFEQQEVPQTAIRMSEFKEPPSLEGCLQIWMPTDETNPPAQIDDSWTENFKQISSPEFVQEWFPQSCLIRLTWTQNLKSLAEKKIPSQVAQWLQEQSLMFPLLPTLRLLP